MNKICAMHYPMKIIKRYSNRRLYDPESSKSITLEEVADIIRSGKDIQVIDQNGKDITSHVLSQTFLKLQNTEQEPLFNFILKALIREGNNDFIDMVKKLIFAGIGMTSISSAERNNIIELLWNNQRKELENDNTFTRLTSAGQNEVEKVWEIFSTKFEEFSGQVTKSIRTTMDSFEKQEHFNRIENKIKELASTVEKIKK